MRNEKWWYHELACQSLVPSHSRHLIPSHSSLIPAFKLMVQRSRHINLAPISLNPLLLLDLHDLFHGDFFFIEGFAGDRTVESHVRELPQVVCTGNAAGSDEVDPG